MRRFLLALLSSSSLVGSASCLLGVLAPAHAAELKALPLDRKVCIESSHSRTNYVCTRVKDITKVKASPAIDLATNPQDSPYALEFSDEESNAAIALFGCDCPLCVNSLRKLRMTGIRSDVNYRAVIVLSLPINRSPALIIAQASLLSM